MSSINEENEVENGHRVDAVTEDVAGTVHNVDAEDDAVLGPDAVSGPDGGDEEEPDFEDALGSNEKDDAEVG